MNETENSTALQAKRISFGYGKALVLKNVDFFVRRGEFVALIGPNGSGKTTLLKIILGALAPLEGDLLLNGKPVLSCPLRERAKKIAYVSQQPFFSFPLTVLELVSLGRYPYGSGFKQGPEDRRVIEESLSLTGSFSLTGRKFTTLSGGEKQKVLISRALAQTSHLLLLDEPTVHLDFYFQLEILKNLKKICREKNLTVVAVLHDLSLVSLFADRALLLKSGGLHAFGKTQEVVNERNIKEAFGVEVVARKDPEIDAWYFLPRKPLP